MRPPEQHELVRHYGQLTLPHEKRMMLEAVRHELEDPGQPGPNHVVFAP